jgi:PadR family transcriptional regulator PadR
MSAVNGEILPNFWKAHILHDAEAEPVHGKWILTELRRHGYRNSGGTLYPSLRWRERLRSLKGKAVYRGGRRARRDYRLTAEGRKVLGLILEQVRELYEEMVMGGRKGDRS